MPRLAALFHKPFVTSELLERVADMIRIGHRTGRFGILHDVQCQPMSPQRRWECDYVDRRADERAEDTTLLGARSLEGLNLRIDAGAKQLVDAGPMPAMAT